MDHKKDIGKLIKEHLANTEVEPNEGLWASIEKTLDDREKRRGGIIWWSAGLLLFIGILVGIYFTYDSKKEVIKNDTINYPIVDSEPEIINRGFDESKKRIKNTSEEADPNIEKLKLNSNIITTESQKTNENQISKTKNYNSNNAESITEISNNSKTKKEVLEYNAVLQQSEADVKKEEVSSSTLNTNVPTNDSLSTSRGNTILNKSFIGNDSIAKTTKPKKKLAKSEIEDEEKKKKEITEKTWSISIQGGPNTFAYLSDGNPFKRSLSDGVLQSDYSYSYGAFLNIPLNDKFTFRFGYRNSSFKYYVERALSGESNNGVLAILNDPSLQRNGTIIPPTFESSISPPNTFRIDQEINYHEIPLQMRYCIRNKRVKIDAILGLSAMLVNKSLIVLSNEENSVNIGSATYLKETSFSSNVGIGFRYKLTDRVSLDLEPTFQFQYGAFNKGYKNLMPVIMTLSAGGTFKL